MPCLNSSSTGHSVIYHVIRKKRCFSCSSIINILFSQFALLLVNIFFSNSLFIPLLYRFSLKHAILIHIGIIFDDNAVNKPINLFAFPTDLI